MGWRRCITQLGLGWLLVLCLAGGLAHAQTDPVDALFIELRSQLGVNPSLAEQTMAKLDALRERFTPIQNERYMLVKASSLGFKGQHTERVALVQSFLPQVTAPRLRVRFFYELIDGLAVLGRYDEALLAMNESVRMVPQLEKVSEKIVALQSAISLLASLRAFDDALDFAERIQALRGSDTATYAECVGLADKVEIHFMRGNGAAARALVSTAIQACEANKNALLTLITHTNAVIGLINSGEFARGLATGLPLLDSFTSLSTDSDYIPQLQEALARAYLHTGDLGNAEHFGLLAFRRAQTGHVLLLQLQTSATMADIKRGQGQLTAAVGYYDTQRALADKVLTQQIQKNLAYQRVTFDAQDKVNQLALLEQKNQNLRMEKALQRRQYENLTLLTVLGLLLLFLVSVWLGQTLRKMDTLRHSAQVDALTRVSNRSHFIDCAQQACKDTHQAVSLVLFDMDFFKHVNDSYGHAVGDWVLRTVCDTIQGHLRKSDRFGRLGGEEFALCLTGLSPEEVLIRTEHYRAAVQAIDTQPSGHAFSITASFGVATRAVGEHTSYEELLVAADKALYMSKNTGRNRISTYASGTAEQAIRAQRRHHPRENRA